jgi:hypothetical protein
MTGLFRSTQAWRLLPRGRNKPRRLPANHGHWGFVIQCFIAYRNGCRTDPGSFTICPIRLITMGKNDNKPVNKNPADSPERHSKLDFQFVYYVLWQFIFIDDF